MAGRLLCWDALLQAEPAGPGSALPGDLRAAAQTPCFLQRNKGFSILPQLLKVLLGIWQLWFW